MKPKPILFNTNMVQALLDGRKTQTRRVIKFPHNDTDGDIPERCAINLDGKYCFYLADAQAPMWRIKPRYQPGDILYVRETWNNLWHYEDGRVFVYKADDIEPAPVGKWRPSIHMPYEAARIFLRVTDVRAERLQDITEKDAKKEGMLRGEEDYDCELAKVFPTASIAAFSRLWDSLNAKRGFAWDSNPWVFVYEFERCEKPQG